MITYCTYGCFPVLHQTWERSCTLKCCLAILPNIYLSPRLLLAVIAKWLPDCKCRIFYSLLLDITSAACTTDCHLTSCMTMVPKVSGLVFFCYYNFSSFTSPDPFSVCSLPRCISHTCIRIFKSSGRVAEAETLLSGLKYQLPLLQQNSAKSTLTNGTNAKGKLSGG